MTKPLAGKVALVTGGGRGLGKAIALHLAQDGAAIAVLSRTATQVEEVAAAIAAAGGKAIGFGCDLTETGAIDRVVERVTRELGPIDILVNNAHDTSVDGMASPVETATAQRIDNQMRSGPYIALALMQACLPHMKKQGGRVINMASTVGVLRIKGFLPYAMAKEALRTLTAMAAREWGQYGITVNAVCPVGDTLASDDVQKAGIVDGYPAPPIARMGDPDKDIAPLVALLAGPGGAYLTGQSYMIDGGGSIDAAR